MAVKIGINKSVTQLRKYVPNVFQYANDKRKLGIFNDVSIKIGNERILANRMILSCCCDFFERLFQIEMKEKYEKEIEIKNVNAKSMKATIDFLYSGCITIDSDTAVDILSTADYLQLIELKEFCSEFLESLITAENCFFLLNIARFYRCERLKKNLYKFIKLNLVHIAETIDFKSLSKDDLKSCFSKLDHIQRGETSVYESLIAWVKHEESKRRNDAHIFFHFIDFTRFSLDYLIDVVILDALIMDLRNVFPILMYSIARVYRRIKLKQSESRIISIGADGTVRSILEIFDTMLHESPKKYPHFPVAIAANFSVKVDDLVICVGECDKYDGVFYETYDSVWKMKLHEENLKWQKASQMNIKRRSAGATFFQNHLVVSGGFDGLRTVYSTSEVYAFALDKWRFISSLQIPRYSHCLLENNGSLFALGGSDPKQDSLDSVERLTGFESTWECVESMKTSRKWFAAVSLDGFIYAIGGCNHFDRTVLKSVEKYDATADKWSFVQDLNIERCWHAACVLHEKIYVVGGMNRYDRTVQEIECYNSETNKWTIVDITPHALYRHALFVI